LSRVDASAGRLQDIDRDIRNAVSTAQDYYLLTLYHVSAVLPVTVDGFRNSQAE